MYLKNSPFIKEIFLRYGYPAVACEAFLTAEEKLSSSGCFSEFESLVKDVISPPYQTEKGFSVFQKRICDLSEKVHIEEKTLSFVLFLYTVEHFKEVLKKRGLPSEFYQGALLDLRAKLLESLEEEGIPGTKEPQWFYRFLSDELYAIGRFQYEPKPMAAYDVTLPCGFTVLRGVPTVGIHIPSHCGPMTDEIRKDSYRRAYDFFSRQLETDTVIFRCSSWLLYPENQNILPSSSNICHFMNDFFIYKEKETSVDLECVFPGASGLPYESLPEQTVLQKSYKERLLSGKPLGKGFGIMLFKNGENITFGNN